MISLLTLLDDIATTLDDVAVMTKVAVQKTSVLMSDDLAVNAGVVQGVKPDRELPIVKAIFIGSLLNKVYAISGVVALMAIYPPIISGIMILGALYLSYEGAHKIHHKLFPSTHKNPNSQSTHNEKSKIKGAIRTDLILSIEIIVIAQSTLSGSFSNQILSLSAVGLIASILIYGLVAIIVKVDDFGLYLVKKGSDGLGMVFVNSMPYFMRALGAIGTLAMLSVGGGIMTHTFHLPLFINEHIQNILTGLVVGFICLALQILTSKFLKTK